MDKVWNDTGADNGGFVQEVTAPALSRVRRAGRTIGGRAALFAFNPYAAVPGPASRGSPFGRVSPSSTGRRRAGSVWSSS
ncbi:hypothetical protein BZZ08_00488 [Streptomyces sp. MH60]|nr:hypothetical protein BZZ08_00488 [Streptomyces sp. MH60]